jgi:hypothetical protein
MKLTEQDVRFIHSLRDQGVKTDNIARDVLGVTPTALKKQLRARGVRLPDKRYRQLTINDLSFKI